MEKNRLLEIIKTEQAEQGYVSKEAMRDIAETLRTPVAHVYGVTTFYSFLSTRPQGRHVIRICKSVPCLLQKGDMLVSAIAAELGIGPGETTADGRFTFELTNCIGACDQAPAMLVNNEVYGNLTSEKVKEILQSYD
ncbi:MAG: NADH-quinone oxidoreductase subunit NuoE [Desulfatiglandaceae bacterium]